jgi:uncharacterized membrane protein YedE/YeeE
MICGLSRLSLRSASATTTFFTTAAVTVNLFHGDLLSISDLPLDWTLGTNGLSLITVGASSLGLSLALFLLVPLLHTPSLSGVLIFNAQRFQGSFPRAIAAFNSAFSFGLFLRLGNMTEPSRILRFLLLPFHAGFDVSLLFLAISALPVSILLYFYGRGDEKPQLGGKWAVPTLRQIDWQLVAGAAIFGVGWGIVGICRECICLSQQSYVNT